MSTYLLEPVYDELTQMWHRGDADLYVAKEQRAYARLADSGIRRPTVLDVGAHIGWFTRFALLELNAVNVLAVEPDPANAALFRHNHPHVGLHEAAAWSGPEKQLDLQISATYSTKNRTDRSIRRRGTLAVPTISFKNLLRGRDLVKCDIEGAEYRLDWTGLPARLRGIAIEFHTMDGAVQLEQLFRLNETIQAQGFHPVQPPRMELTYAGTTVGVYLR